MAQGGIDVAGSRTNMVKVTTNFNYVYVIIHPTHSTDADARMALCSPHPSDQFVFNICLLKYVHYLNMEEFATLTATTDQCRATAFPLKRFKRLKILDLAKKNGASE